MEYGRTYRERYEKKAAISAVLTAMVNASGTFREVSSEPGILVSSPAMPVCAILNTSIEFLEDDTEQTWFIVVKNQGNSLNANDALVLGILDQLEDHYLGRACRGCVVKSVDHDMDTNSTSKAATRTIFSRIELEIQV
jgi:hypothetical protein